MKKAIISVMFGRYDNLKPAPKFKGWDKIMFTDQTFNNNKGWTIHPIDVEISNEIDSRFYKWCSHRVIPEYDVVCYIDASMEMIQEPPLNIWFRHPNRTSVWAEADRIIELNKADPMLIAEQVEYYCKAGYNDTEGLYQCGFFVREHSKEMNRLGDEVFGIVYRYSHRDQLAFPFALHTTQTKLTNVQYGKDSWNYIIIHRHA